MREHPHEYILENVTVPALTHTLLLKHSSELTDTQKRGFFELRPEVITINAALFSNPAATISFPEVAVTQTENSLLLSCPCSIPKKKLCEHQLQVLYNIMDRPYLRIFFDAPMRRKKMQQEAAPYGLENAPDPEAYFELVYTNKAVEIRSKIKELLPVNAEQNTYLKAQLLPATKAAIPGKENTKVNTKTILVFRKHKYYDQFNIGLYEGGTSKDGKIKNPLTALDASGLIWKTDKVEEAKFYSGISKFQNSLVSGNAAADLEALKMIVNNPLQLDTFYHDAGISENITATSVLPVFVRKAKISLQLSVDLRGEFYEVSGELTENENRYLFETLKIRYSYFIETGGSLNLITDTHLLRVIDFFKNNNHKVLIHVSKFEEFRQNILVELEHKVSINYSYVKAATKKQITEQHFDKETARIIYLKDQENYVSIIPVMKYGNVEIPVFSRKQIYDTDQNGNVFKVNRDEEAEQRFTSVILRQHPEFEEQLSEVEYFYLHKDKFLDKDWFLEAFEEWKNQEILVLGFNELKNNRLNSNKATVSVKVISGIDWFNAAVTLQYGKQKAALKEVHRSIRNKNKFVQLGDGTMGILPEEWIKKFAAYFEAGELDGEQVRIPKTNFRDIHQLFEEEVISTEVKRELATYEQKFADMENIKEIPVPEALKTTLRDYQRQGLNWLNMLDDLNFGACLADDMGLGKTIQVIAFILSQRKKQEHNTNLVVVPTSLLFNWQAEVKKFAPSVKLFTNYGNSKIKEQKEFDQYEIVLTTYGMLLSDIHFLKDYRFNYIFLDESQAIKNPESQRYKAARMLQSRNKVVLTGTPVENNTFDLYGQLSFACPGLLGNKQFFKDTYSTPIDTFGDRRRAIELQKKIKPFILRRTKKQVATELPEKTEMVIYCEMGDEQRKIYNAHEKELRDFISAKDESEIKKNSMHVLTGLTKLRQICNSPALLKEGLHEDFSSKTELLIEQIENKSPQHKILVFSQFVTMLDLIAKKLKEKNIRFEYLTGQTKNREARVSNFQSEESVRVFLISLKAGGTGLNLTEADYVYIVDPWWNPAVENQAIDRSYRIGQKKNVIAVRLICPDTIEEKIMKLQESKTKLVNELIKTEGALVKSLSKKELLSML